MYDPMYYMCVYMYIYIYIYKHIYVYATRTLAIQMEAEDKLQRVLRLFQHIYSFSRIATVKKTRARQFYSSCRRNHEHCIQFVTGTVYTVQTCMNVFIYVCMLCV